MDTERTAWNARYREGSHSSLNPDPFLLQSYDEFIAPLFPKAGTALDLAGGIGRHAIWLAQHGWQVTLADISEIAIAKARENAGASAANINFEIRDLDTFRASKKYDLILVFYYLQRGLFPQLAKALNHGGLLIYKTYTQSQAKFAGGPSHPMHLLEESELLHAFSGLTVLHYHETVRDRGVAEFLGAKRRAIE
jgi:tellurite methyltransferase